MAKCTYYYNTFLLHNLHSYAVGLLKKGVEKYTRNVPENWPEKGQKTHSNYKTVSHSMQQDFPVGAPVPPAFEREEGV